MSDRDELLQVGACIRRAPSRGCLNFRVRGLGDWSTATDLEADFDKLIQALREHEEDLAAVRSRAKERALSYEEFLSKLKADGTR